jgi:hypothetical protein
LGRQRYGWFGSFSAERGSRLFNSARVTLGLGAVGAFFWVGDDVDPAPVGRKIESAGVIPQPRNSRPVRLYCPDEGTAKLADKHGWFEAINNVVDMICGWPTASGAASSSS